MAAATYAFVTLLTSDSYLPGALVAINSLLDVEGVTPQRAFDTVCLVTPSTVGQDAIKALEKTFDHIVGVEEITTASWAELDLLGRRDLAASLTKLHLFRLVQYSKVIFLDADTLALRPLSPLFDLPNPFSAAPDQGWPDAFNSGLMVATPSDATFDGLMNMMSEKGTWDGGDQGLLNDFFPNWNRLSFTYNVTPSAYYTYAPAYRRHGGDVSVLHFIGTDKPWKRGQRSVYVPEAAQQDYYGLVNKWFDVYERHFGTSLTYDVAGRVVQPPGSFKSSFTTLPSRSSPLHSPPIVAPSPVKPGEPLRSTWDPARSSPPRDHQPQMAVPFNDHYENIWDDPSKAKQRTRFQPPSSYPSIPESTKEWYHSVIQNDPDPSALKPVFPWEERAVQAKRVPSRSFPQEEPPRGLPPARPNTSAAGPSAYVPTVPSGPTFVNAWDAIPGIGKYAKNLAKQTGGQKKVPGLPGSREGDDSMGGRTSSLKEPKAYERKSDASSRDGDDEDDEDQLSDTDDNGQKARMETQLKTRDGTVFGTIPGEPRIRTGNLTPDNGSGSSGSPSGSVPGSPTKSRRGNLSPRLSSHSNSPPEHHVPKSPRSNAPLSPVLATSPRLAAQAIRNSTAARLTAGGTGTGDAPPVVRATRVFSPDTDPGVVKKQGMAALHRFVENMENGNPLAGEPRPPSI